MLVVYVPWVDYSKWEMWCLGGVVVRSDELFEKISGELFFSKKFFFWSQHNQSFRGRLSFKRLVLVPVFLQVFSRVLEHLLLVLSLLRLLLVLLSDFRVLSLPFWRSIAGSFCLCCLYWRSCFLVSYGIASRAGVFINVQAGVSSIVVVFFFLWVFLELVFLSTLEALLQSDCSPWWVLICKLIGWLSLSDIQDHG